MLQQEHSNCLLPTISANDFICGNVTSRFYFAALMNVALLQDLFQEYLALSESFLRTSVEQRSSEMPVVSIGSVGCATTRRMASEQS